MMVDSIVYFDYDRDFVCCYSLVNGRPLLRGVYGNLLHECLKDIYKDMGTRELEALDECILMLKNIPETLIVVGGVDEKRKTIPNIDEDEWVVYYQKDRFHYGTKDIFSVVKKSVKEHWKRGLQNDEFLDKMKFLLDYFGPEQLFEELKELLKNCDGGISSYVRTYFENRVKSKWL